MVHLHIEVILSWTFLELVIVIWTISFNMQNSRMCFVEVTVDFIIIVHTESITCINFLFDVMDNGDYSDLK